jgi:hypothetical protein
MVYLDLDELAEVFRGRWFWSTHRPAPARFRRSDHLGDSERPLADCVRELVEERIGRRPLGPIRLLTHLRYGGYIMNPLSVYYCFDAEGDRVEAAVAEVTNTPWGERYCYVIDCDAARHARGAIREQTPKEFHVSPFMDMDLVYDWRLCEPDRHLRLGIANRESDGEVLFYAELALKRREISGASLARVLLRYPLLTFQVVTAIYWQALRLWLKGVPFYSHPRKREAALEATS